MGLRKKLFARLMDLTKYLRHTVLTVSATRIQNALVVFKY
jgi:hypothetical protein